VCKIKSHLCKTKSHRPAREWNLKFQFTVSRLLYVLDCEYDCLSDKIHIYIRLVDKGLIVIFEI